VLWLEEDDNTNARFMISQSGVDEDSNPHIHDVLSFDNISGVRQESLPKSSQPKWPQIHRFEPELGSNNLP
jgi:hypothetical protein